MTWRERWRTQREALSRRARGWRHALRRWVGPPASERSPGDAAAFVAAGLQAQSDEAPAVAPGQFTAGVFGARMPRLFMLFEPARTHAGPAPLLVLLHGCQQGAAEFASGTRMNEAAAVAGVVVLYPEQSRAANLLRCWNWYARHDGAHDSDDAAVIVAMTRKIIATHDIDPARVYVAGMSAGGGMAAVLARDHPELYAALGVHSGVPAGLAHDVFSAMRLMSGGPAAGRFAAPTPALRPLDLALPRIVFHGDQDHTVHPSNGHAIHAGHVPADPVAPTLLPLQATTDAAAGRRGFTRSVEYGPGGVTHRELWMIHGAGHAWAGGSDDARDADAQGPFASREMLRFLLQHRQP
jgi:poly(hydroxyalkanoate) depolymerase family esterase